MILYYNPKNKNFARDNRNQYIMVKHEGIFWNLVLKKDQTGFRFLRQKIIGNYIIDFYCHRLKLGIEIDGDSHNRQGKYDETREKYFNNLGIKITRYTNNDIDKNLNGIIIDLQEIIKEREKELKL